MVAVAIANGWLSSDGGGLAWELWALWQQLCLWTLFLQNLARCIKEESEALQACTATTVALYTMPLISELADTMKDWVVTGICILHVKTWYGVAIGAALVGIELAALKADWIPRFIPISKMNDLYIRPPSMVLQACCAALLVARFHLWMLLPAMAQGDMASYESVLAQNVQLKLDLQSSLSELSRKEDLLEGTWWVPTLKSWWVQWAVSGGRPVHQPSSGEAAEREYGNCPQFKAEKGFQKLYQNIADHNPIDLIGFQEPECNDVGKVLIGSNLTHFQFYAPAGDAPLAWNAERFDRVGEGGTIAVAEERRLRPQDKYGVRFVNFIRLVEKKSREVIFFANTHGPLLQCAGEKGEKVAANYLQVIDTHKQPGDKVIFTGDFNCASTDPPLLKLQKKLKNAATDMTFAGADHILTSHDVITCTNEFSQGFPSDHDILTLGLHPTGLARKGRRRRRLGRGVLGILGLVMLIP
eukprot:g12080.t1